MSASDKITPTNKVNKSKWRFVLWFILACLVVLLIAVALIWQNRYDLLERQVRKEFAKMDIVAELNIDRIDQQNASVKDISLSADGQEFFTAERIDFEYAFKQALKGQFERLTFVRPSMHLTLDAGGNIIDGWMPGSSTGGDGLHIPPRGIEVKDARIHWQAPYGKGTINTSAEIKTQAVWTLQIHSQDTVFTANEPAVQINYDASFQSLGTNQFTALGTISTPGLQTKNGQIGRAKAAFDLGATLDDTGVKLGISGGIKFDFAQANTGQFSIDNSQIKLDIDVALNPLNRKIKSFNSAWDLNGQNWSVTDPDLRGRWADLLSSHDNLSDVVIAKYFTGFFKDKSESLMQNFDVSGRGKFNYDPSGYRLDLLAPLEIASKAQKMTIAPGDDVLVYDANGQNMVLRADIGWHTARPVQIKNLHMVMPSRDGLSATGLDSLEMRLVSKTSWRTRTQGQDIRLAPFDLAVSYNNYDTGSRKLKLSGHMDYDGPVPGGIATGYKMGGALNVLMQGDDFRLGLEPVGVATAQAFNSDTGWRADDIVLTFSRAGEFYQRTEGQPSMALSLHDISAQITSPEGERHLDSRFERVDILADLSTAPKKWDFVITRTDIKSDDFPSPGTHIISPTGTLSVLQGANNDIEFTVISPQTSVETQNVEINDMQIKLAGRADDFTADYQAGSVKFIGGDIPIIPMQGHARFREGELTGEALTQLPQTKNTPIDIIFRSLDGRGTVDINIAKMVFDPQGLQPQYLVPTLSGKLADVRGELSAQFNFVFGGGGPVRSSGVTSLKNMDVGTLVGPFSGVNATLGFSSIFPLKTDGVQEVTVSGFDPGFPLKDGRVKFEIVPGGVRIDQAIWPVAGESVETTGTVSIDPVTWQFGDVKNRVIARVENLSLGTLLAEIGKDKFTATGQIFGVLPAVIDGVNLEIEEGVLAVKDGGVIRFKSAGTDAASAQNRGTEIAFEALQNFQYKELEVKIDGPLDGEMAIKMLFEGRNPDVLGGALFEFDVTVAGELANIARNTANAFKVRDKLGDLIGEQSE